MNKAYYVYIMTNISHASLYTGITSNLKKRIWQHKEKQVEGFTERYNISKLVYYEAFNDIQYALQREKQIKAGSRQKKLNLIDKFNNDWKDLYPLL